MEAPPSSGFNRHRRAINASAAPAPPKPAPPPPKPGTVEPPPKKKRVLDIFRKKLKRGPCVSRRPLQAIDATRVHQTRSWVVSFAVRTVGRRRGQLEEMLTVPPAELGSSQAERISVAVAGLEHQRASRPFVFS